MIAGAAAAVGMGALPAVALAQDGQEASQIEEVVVTGSRIRRDPTNAPTPLIQVSREDLVSTGVNTMIDYLATIPALSNSQVPSDTVGVLNSGGLSLPNLRSLGSGRTLTLVDGRRHVGSGQGSLSVDVDTIPRLLIENIEIVTGGASSVYGADAVSGVLNFVLRKDFEGLEIDGNVGQITDTPKWSQRLSILGGMNLLDDRLNVYGYAEYEHQDFVVAADIDWLDDSWILVGNDGDVTGVTDGVWDNLLWRDARTLNIANWGVVVLANTVQPSPTNDPDVGISNPACTSFTSANCYNNQPGTTWVFDGNGARLANFGTIASGTGLSRTVNSGGDGTHYGTRYNVDSSLPESDSLRLQAGFNFELSDALTLYGEAKYVDEHTQLTTGPNFADIYISDTYSAANSQPILSSRAGAPRAFAMRLDNPFLPDNLRQAILANTVTLYGAPTATTPGQLNPATTRSAPYARWSAWTTDRFQDNTRELQRYVIGARGDLGDLFFLKDANYDFGYTYGQVDIVQQEHSDDGERFAYAIDARVDTAGLLGTPGALVCAVQLLTAGGGTVTDRNTGAAIGASDPDVQQCVPLNPFGEGNQSEAALDYVAAFIQLDQRNVQHDALATISGQLWDFWGAGEIGVALGAEWRREETEGTGRDRTTAGRWLQLNGGPDFLPAAYETKEWFAELAIPLFRDSWLGQYAELSGSYRQSDFSTTGKSDVYGVNLVYRPVNDFAIRSSFNTSQRAPSLGEIYAPATGTFLGVNANVDPCSAATINNLADRTIAGYRIANCEALAAQLGLGGRFNFADQSAANAYLPAYPSSIPGFLSGNPFLLPETSESFTFSTVWTPSFIPNFSLVLDYYEITIDSVIAAVTASTALNNCVSGPTLNASACSTITRTPTQTASYDNTFYVTSFIQGSINYAKRDVSGLDFTLRYGFDTVDLVGRDFGKFSYNLNGSWLIEQENYNNIDNPNDVTSLQANLFYPRVRYTSQLAWTPIQPLTVTWTMDWQSAQNIVRQRDIATNTDNRYTQYYDTGDFARHDFTVRYQMRDNLTIRAGVTNAFDNEQAPWLGSTLYSNFDAWGRRFFLGFNYRPW